MSDYETTFADKYFKYSITSAEKDDENEVIVEGSLTRAGTKGKAFFKYTYGCDDEEEDLKIKKKSSAEMTQFINEDELDDDIMKKIRTSVVKKGVKLRPCWLEGYDPVNPKSKNNDETDESSEEEDDDEEDEEEEEEEASPKTPKGKRPRRNSIASNKSNKSDKSSKSSKSKKSKKSKKSEDDMTPANRLTSLNLKVKARKAQIENAKAERAKADEQFKSNANRLNKYAKHKYGSKQFGEIMANIVKLKALKTDWADYDYKELEDENDHPYEPGDEPEGHSLHDLAELLRSVANIVDSKNLNVEVLEKERDELTAKWLKARREHTKTQYFEMTGTYPTDLELKNMGV